VELDDDRSVGVFGMRGSGDRFERAGSTEHGGVGISGSKRVQVVQLPGTV
jgi:hypothetical protein